MPAIIKYPEYKAVFHDGKNPITVKLAKDIVGWITEEEAGTAFGNNFLFKDILGNKVRCKNNTNNRPFVLGTMEALVQELLNRRYCGANGNGETLNGEPIILSKTGVVLNGQHSLCALPIAEQIRQRDIEKWKKNWPGPVVMDKLIVYGISDADIVVNTMDTARPRNLTDVIFRSKYFGSKSTMKVKKDAARILDHATRLVWQHTGENVNPYAPRRTHAEAIDFISRHRRLIKAVKHIMDENKEESISKYIASGYAAGMLYLMGCSSTPDDKVAEYYSGTSRNEKDIDWTQWDTALDFWMQFAAGKFTPLTDLLAILSDGIGTSRITEKKAAISLAWKQFMWGKEIDKVSLKLTYGEKTGRLAEDYSMGGIDLGVHRITTTLNPDEEPDEPDEEEIAADVEKRKQEEQEKKSYTDMSIPSKVKYLQEKYGGRILLHRNSLGNYIAWDEDAREVAAFVGREAKMRPEGLIAIAVQPDELKAVMEKMLEANYKIGIDNYGKGNFELFDSPPKKKHPKPATTSKE